MISAVSPVVPGGYDPRRAAFFAGIGGGRGLRGVPCRMIVGRNENEADNDDGGRDHHRRHQDDADGLQPDDDREHEDGGEKDIDPPHPHPQAGAESPVERQQLDLLPAEHHEDDGDAAETRDHRHVPGEERRGLAEEEPVEPRLAGVGEPLRKSEQDEPQAEEDREDEAECTVLLHPRAADHTDHRQCSQPTRRRRSPLVGARRSA